MPRALIALLLLLPALPAPAADVPLDARVQITFYGDNTEFFNPFRQGETLLGAWSKAFLVARPSESVEVRAGVFANRRFGAQDEFEDEKPVLALKARRGRSAFVFGSLETFRRSEGPGPDREGPHGLLPPIQIETLSFTRPHENGLQWLFDGERVQSDLWLNWQTLIAPGQTEVFDAGGNARIRVGEGLRLSLQVHEVHHGGQLYDVGPTADSLAGVVGVQKDFAPKRLDRLEAEAHAVFTTDNPDRTDTEIARGFGGLLRVSADRKPWRAHLLAWRGDGALKAEGDPAYLGRRLDGTVFRAPRDYAELGLTRTFAPAPGIAFEASLRLHRTERYVEYSYRILGLVDLDWALLR